jgi:MscS family membrane protein
VAAYLHALDWEAFLETQQEVLLEVMGIIERSGTSIAFPSQTLYFADAQDPSAADRPGSARFDAHRPVVGPG